MYFRFCFVENDFKSGYLQKEEYYVLDEYYKFFEKHFNINVDLISKHLTFFLKIYDNDKMCLILNVIYFNLNNHKNILYNANYILAEFVLRTVTLAYKFYYLKWVMPQAAAGILFRLVKTSENLLCDILAMFWGSLINLLFWTIES